MTSRQASHVATVMASVNAGGGIASTSGDEVDLESASTSAEVEFKSLVSIP